ncbi:MAG: AIPR family protein [Atopobiaceae bacterium]|nr:AIPR family protein [Atopobiaceae bacterium]
MPKKLTITQEAVQDYISGEKDRYGTVLTDSEVFERIASQQVLKQYAIDDDETERGIVGGGNDGGYDGIFVFSNEVLVSGEDTNSLEIQNRSAIDIYFIQAKNSYGFSESIVQNWKTSFPNLIENPRGDAQRYNTDVIEAFTLIRSILKKTVVSHLCVTLNFVAVSLAEETHINLEKQAEELTSIVYNIIPSQNAKVTTAFINVRKLYELIEQAPDETRSIRATKEPLCPDESSAILVVELGEYYKFITDDNGLLIKDLFESNIRDYQGNIEVNKAIRATLEKQNNIDFWWLNNGITIVAETVTRDMGSTITMKNPRIVNGLQTSNEIRRYCHNNTEVNEHRKVLVKCIATSSQENRSAIIEATNKQSTIPPAFLRSLDTIQLQIERYFTNHNLHYDRRKSSCRNAGIPAKEIISLPFLGQCLISILLQQPDYARARPAQVLNDDKKYQTIFNESISLEAYLRVGSLALYTRQWLKESSYSRGAQNDIMFYVLLFICIKQVGHENISPSDLLCLEIPSEWAIEDYACQTHNAYVRLGGNPTVAKGRGLVREVVQLAMAEKAN